MPFPRRWYGDLREPRYGAFVVRVGGLERVDLGPAPAIDSLVSRFRSALGDPRTSAAVREIGRALDERVMRPVRAHAGAARHLLVVPDGSLQLIPFGALVDEQGTYLAERYTTTYLTSGRELLRRAGRSPGAPSPALLVAAPDFDTPVGGGEMPSASTARGIQVAGLTLPPWQPLPGTLVEVEALLPLLRDAQTVTGGDALEILVKSVRSPLILHLATHAYFLPGTAGSGRRPDAASNPRWMLEGVAALQARETEDPLLRAGLALAGANRRDGGAGEDGVLTALEVAGLDLQATELVVLSACETGLGEVWTGDGLYGLRRALTVAGARSQVMSLWRVSDDATADLMVEFYRRLARGEGRSEALRNAGLAFLRSSDHAHPYYWASFVSIGDWTPLPDRATLRP